MKPHPLIWCCPRGGSFPAVWLMAGLSINQWLWVLAMRWFTAEVLWLLSRQDLPDCKLQTTSLTWMRRQRMLTSQGWQVWDFCLAFVPFVSLGRLICFPVSLGCVKFLGGFYFYVAAPVELFFKFLDVLSCRLSSIFSEGQCRQVEPNRP